MEVINKIGADALRYTLQSQTGTNQDIRYSEKRTEEARNFCNKMWNATRFVLMNLDGGMPAKPASFEPTDRWLLSRLAATENLDVVARETELAGNVLDGARVEVGHGSLLW